MRRKVAGRKRETEKGLPQHLPRPGTPLGRWPPGDGLGNCRIFVIMPDH